MGEKFEKKPWNQKDIWSFQVYKKLNVQLLKSAFLNTNFREQFNFEQAKSGTFLLLL